jgi:hypothetical protein
MRQTRADMFDIVHAHRRHCVERMGPMVGVLGYLRAWAADTFAHVPVVRPVCMRVRTFNSIRRLSEWPMPHRYGVALISGGCDASHSAHEKLEVFLFCATAFCCNGLWLIVCSAMV